jgi:hypothetical protein
MTLQGTSQKDIFLNKHYIDKETFHDQFERSC